MMVCWINSIFKANENLYFLAPLVMNVSHVIQHEKDVDTVLICQGSKIKYLIK